MKTESVEGYTTCTFMRDVSVPVPEGMDPMAYHVYDLSATDVPYYWFFGVGPVDNNSTYTAIM